MSGPDGQVSQRIDDELSLNHSAGSGEVTELPPEASTYFDAWLESIQPQLSSSFTEPQS